MPRQALLAVLFGVLIPLVGSAESFSKWSLWSGGTRLRGANIWQTIVGDQDSTVLGPGYTGPPYSNAILQALRARGANFVSISGPGVFAERPPYAFDQRALNALDQLVDQISAAGLYSVISFRTGPGRSEATFAVPSSESANLVWKVSAAQDAWVAMWRKVADHYRNNPNVIGLNLMVEPNSNAVLMNEWDPTSFFAKHGGSLYDWNALANRITAAIREVDNDVPILINPMNWGDLAWLPKERVVNDPHVVYSISQYEPFAYTHQKPPLTLAYPGSLTDPSEDGPVMVNRAWLDKLIAPIKTWSERYHHPVAVLEFGLMRWEPGLTQFLQDQMEAFEATGLNHALWLWESDYPGVDWDDFNFRVSPPQQLFETLSKVWSRNTDFPAMPLPQVKPGRKSIRLTTRPFNRP